MGSTPRPDSGHVHHLAQINDQLLIKVVLFGTPSVSTFIISGF
jgi:hypothetical protein